MSHSIDAVDSVMSASTGASRDSGARPRPNGRPRGSPRDSVHPDQLARMLANLLAAVRWYFVESKRVAKGRPPTSSLAASRRAADHALLGLRKRVLAISDRLELALAADREIRSCVLSLSWCIDRLEGRPRAPWVGWTRVKRRLQRHLLWCRRFRITRSRADERLRRLHGGVQGALRALNLQRGPIGPIHLAHAGQDFGAASLPDVDLAPAPPPMVLLAGRALASVQESFVLGARGLAPDTMARRTLDGFTIAWSVVSQCALDRACAADSAPFDRVAFGIAGVALACVVAEQSPEAWHRHALDERLRAVSKAPGLPAGLRALAARAALLRLPADDVAALEVLAQLTEREFPNEGQSGSLKARIDRLPAPLRRVAEELYRRYPKFLPPGEMASIYGESGHRSKASTIANTLRRRHGIRLESAKDARRRDSRLATSLGKGYRLAEAPT